MGHLSRVFVKIMPVRRTDLIRLELGRFSSAGKEEKDTGWWKAEVSEEANKLAKWFFEGLMKTQRELAEKGLEDDYW